ncbi:hypothetical protein BC567DRAFT_213044 [Phyllosticta citribraziliensis]
MGSTVSSVSLESLCRAAMFVKQQLPSPPQSCPPSQQQQQQPYGTSRLRCDPLIFLPLKFGAPIAARMDLVVIPVNQPALLCASTAAAFAECPLIGRGSAGVGARSPPSPRSGPSGIRKRRDKIRQRQAYQAREMDSIVAWRHVARPVLL